MFNFRTLAFFIFTSFFSSVSIAEKGVKKEAFARCQIKTRRNENRSSSLALQGQVMKHVQTKVFELVCYKDQEVERKWAYTEASYYEPIFYSENSLRCQNPDEKSKLASIIKAINALQKDFYSLEKLSVYMGSCHESEKAYPFTIAFSAKDSVAKSLEQSHKDGELLVKVTILDGNQLGDFDSVAQQHYHPVLRKAQLAHVSEAAASDRLGSAGNAAMPDDFENFKQSDFTGVCREDYNQLRSVLFHKKQHMARQEAWKKECER